MIKHDITGQKFGRLLVLEYAGKANDGHSKWLCRCDCGTEKIIAIGSLMDGGTVSCGCYAREAVGNRNRTHGKSRIPLYSVWNDMKYRCENPHAYNYNNYGGRGIKLCDEWHEFEPFYEWSMNNGYEKGLSIDRIDNSGDYEPDNCRWVDMKIQGRNRRTNVYLTYNGETKSVPEWAEIVGISRRVIAERVRKGWSVEKALTTPLQLSKSHRKGKTQNTT